MKRKIGPRVTEATEVYLEGNFKSLSGGAEYIINASPLIAQRAISAIKGKFTEQELIALIKSMEGRKLLPEAAGGQLIEAIMIYDFLAQSQGQDVGIKTESLISKIEKLSYPDRLYFEVWVAAFWWQKDVLIEDYVSQLL